MKTLILLKIMVIVGLVNFDIYIKFFLRINIIFFLAILNLFLSKISPAIRIILPTLEIVIPLTLICEFIVEVILIY
jgi:hypothetical protein